MERERRHATVLFADVSGFTATAQKLDPEELVDIMNRCLELLEAAVLNNGGHVDKYEGDCIMALFGAPTAIENTARAAFNTAIEMRKCIETLNGERRTPAPLDIHIGINTGLVVAGEVGGAVKRDFTVMGDAVNLAARLKDQSPRGKIWVGPDTYRHTRAEFEYQTLEPVALKNVERPVPVFEVRSLEPRRHRPGVTAAERGVSSPLVGRTAELAQLRSCFRKLAAGQGGVVSVVAE